MCFPGEAMLALMMVRDTNCIRFYLNPFGCEINGGY